MHHFKINSAWKYLQSCKRFLGMTLIFFFFDPFFHLFSNIFILLLVYHTLMETPNPILIEF